MRYERASALPIVAGLACLLASAPGAAQESVWVEGPSPTPSPRQASQVTVLGDGQALLQGGVAARNTRPDDAWLWSGDHFRRLTSARTPGGRNSAAIGTTGEGDVILFGGTDDSRTIIDETWRWDGTDWSRLSPATHPSRRGSVASISSRRTSLLSSLAKRLWPSSMSLRRRLPVCSSDRNVTACA